MGSYMTVLDYFLWAAENVATCSECKEEFVIDDESQGKCEDCFYKK